MVEKFEPKDIDEVGEVLKHFNQFHDGYVASIEIKFENYKTKDNAIKNADKTIILKVDNYPNKQFVHVEFVDVTSFEIISEWHTGPRAGPTWGICQALTMPASEPNEHEIFWDFYFLCAKAKYKVTCSRIVFYEFKDTG